MAHKRKLKRREHRVGRRIVKVKEKKWKRFKYNLGLVYNRRTRAWAKAPVEWKGEAPMKTPSEIEEEAIKATMIRKFEAWGSDKSSITRKLVNALENTELRPEGDDDWQLGMIYELEKGKGIKLRYNTRTKELKIDLRGYQYKFSRDVRGY